MGLLNPIGLLVTIMSAAASSFGGLAGFISIGYAGKADGNARSFVVARNLGIMLAGATVLVAFAVILGPSRHF